MENAREKLEELNLSRDEVERLGEALKNKEFRKLLADYVEEVQDPENRKRYQEEITQLEKERGVDVTFINPEPGYVIKTSVNGSQKGFVNICMNANVQKPSSSPRIQEGSKGLNWSLPHSLSPPREDVDNKGERCKVFDVVFHPNTLHLANKNKAFASMVNKIACDAVETHFDVTLDKKNLKFPKLKYKGMVHATVIKKASNAEPVERCGEEKEFYDKLYKHVDELSNDSSWKTPRKTRKSRQNIVDDMSNYTIPKYVMKHRSHVDLEDFTEHKGSKLNAAIPKELVVEVSLPLLKSSTDISLDVTEKTVQLISEKPAKYKLNLTLPYVVHQDGGNAKFDKDAKKLVVTLPVKRRSFSFSDLDSGIESDHYCSTTPESDTSVSDSLLGAPVQELSEQTSKIAQEPSDSVVQNSPHYRTSFLDQNLHYSLPDYSCHLFENVIALTLNVSNVDKSSIFKVIGPSSFHLKFASLSPSFFTMHYAFLIKFSDISISEDNLQIQVWDNNLILQITSGHSLGKLNTYQVGVCEDDLKMRYIREPSVLNGLYEKATLEAIIEDEIERVDENCQAVCNNTKRRNENLQETKNICTIPSKPDEQNYRRSTNLKQLFKEASVDCRIRNRGTQHNQCDTKAIDIVSFSYESSGDELSYSYSPSKSKGILKRLARKPFGRSISESSLDDFCSSSFENCHTSVDSVIPEDGEVASSLKKTVRFNDVVSKQLYRSNSSILGQKKKNQRKSKNKKKAQIRRVSESDVSELDDKKETDSTLGVASETEAEKDALAQDDEVEMEEILDNDIFQIELDM